MWFKLAEAPNQICQRTIGPENPGTPCLGKACNGLRTTMENYTISGEGPAELKEDSWVRCIYSEDAYYVGYAIEDSMDMKFKIKLHRKVD